MTTEAHRARGVCLCHFRYHAWLMSHLTCINEDEGGFTQ